MALNSRQFPNLEMIEDAKDFIVLNKPEGLQVHPDSKNSGDTLTDYLLEKFPQIKQVGESPERPGIVHRLDKGTSGIMLVAKNNKAFQCFKRQFQERKIQKTYLALAHGNFKKEEGEIDLEIGRSLKNTAVRTTSPYSKDKKEARTLYKVKERFKLEIFKSKRVDYTLLEAFPKTGRTHQIRVHLKALGHPIVGDPVYRFKRLIIPQNLKRMFLMAKKIEFNDLSGKRKVFEIELDQDLRKVLKSLRRVRHPLS